MPTLVVNHSHVYRVIKDTFPEHPEFLEAVGLLDQAISAAQKRLRGGDAKAMAILLGAQGAPAD